MAKATTATARKPAAPRGAAKHKGGKPLVKQEVAKQEPKQTQQKQKQQKQTKDAAKSAAGTKHDRKSHASTSASTPLAAPSAALQSVVTKMEDPSVSWFDVVKPLKDLKPDVAAIAASARVAGNSRKKNKKLQEIALAKAAADGSLGDADASRLPDAQVDALKRRAQQLLDDVVRRHELKRNAKLSSDDKYLATMMKNGTLADRVAALTLTIQGAPFFCLSRLSQLITMASKKARRESMMAVDSLKDLMINNLLPDNRRLRFFHQNALGHPSVTDAHLVLWFFEHCLKTAFATLVGVLASGMDDAVDNHKRACIRAANALLAAKPEQEAVLLAMLVNKLGDPDRKIASYIHKTLQELLAEHPVMKRVVIDEVERVLTRGQVSDRTKYNAILFMNQLYLDKNGDDADLAAHLISVYFALFTKEVHGDRDTATNSAKNTKKNKNAKKKNAPLAADGMDRKLLSALLVGVNRAFPYAQTTSAQFHDEIDALFAVVHRAHHSTSVQALMLLFQVMSSTHSVSDRFYTALYDKLWDPQVRATSKHTLFLNLVFRAMKADVSPARAGAMMKRLLQLTTVMPPAFACAVLFLLSELLKIKPMLRTLIDQPESSGAGLGAGVGAAGDDGDEHFEDVKGDDNSDDDAEPQQFALEDDDDEDDEPTDNEDNEDVDAPELKDGLTDAERTTKVLEAMFGKAPAAKATKTVAATTFDESDSEDDDEQPAGSTTTTPSGNNTVTATSSYDPRKRNPLFAGAETACAWELHHLVHHYHPSVQMFARQLVSGAGITYAGDPLVDFTMLAFFEKFMNKKPRHKVTAGGAASTAAGKSWSIVPINSEAVLDAAEESIDATDKFFYKFFQERAARASAVPALAKKRAKQAAAKAKAAARDDDRDADAFSDFGSDDEDDELEAYAQELAEGIMKDGDLDDEDPDMDDWSDDGNDGEGGDDGSDDDDGGELDGEVDGNAAFGGDADSDDDDGGDLELDDGDDDDDDDDDNDDEDGFDFGAMDGDMDGSDNDEDDDELVAAAKKKKKTPPAPKRKSPFASADDYDMIMQQALEKQAAGRTGGRSKKQKRS